MGGALRKVGMGMGRPVKNYNVEERAFKVISREKPTPAPVHRNMKEIMEEIKRDPELLSRGKLDPKTMENLSKVFIKSEGDNPIFDRQKKRRLPEKTEGFVENEYGYEEPKVIPQGKASIRQIIELLNNHEQKPKEYTAEKIAEEYKLDVADVKSLLKYYKPFQVYLPKKKPKPEQPRLNPLMQLQQKIDNLKN